MKDISIENSHFASTAEQLEQALGDPMNVETPFSFQRSMELDESETFPAELCEQIEKWGVQDFYVPVEYGGKLRRLDETFTLVRAISRRDLSVAIAHSKTFLGSAPIWIAGTAEQQLSLAQRILRREYVVLALTEEAHGGDLAASDCTARKIRNRYLLSGAKWLINNATRGTVMCLLARTNAHKGVSLFYVEKEKLEPASFSHHPKIKTHGIRGIDISGIAFENAVIPEEALIGKEHHGLEPILKTFQFTRPLCSALSLGAADTALRLALNFAQQRHIYDRSVFELPAARDVLVGAFLDILICDCMALFAARALHVVPEQMSLWSSVTKYFVPMTLENMVRDTATILGARYFLREHYVWGIFQKIVRDIAIVSLFDGSTRLNLSLIASQLAQVAHYEETFGEPPMDKVLSRLAHTCSFAQGLPTLDYEKLALTNRGSDDLRWGLLAATEHFKAASEFEGISQSLAADLSLLLERFVLEREALDQTTRDMVAAQREIHISVEGFGLARRHCILHAASACFYMWWFNRAVIHETLVTGDWLVLCLLRLLKLLYPQEELISTTAYTEQVTTALLQMVKEERMFSIMPFQLASSLSSLKSEHL